MRAPQRMAIRVTDTLCACVRRSLQVSLLESIGQNFPKAVASVKGEACTMLGGIATSMN